MTSKMAADLTEIVLQIFPKSVDLPSFRELYFNPNGNRIAALTKENSIAVVTTGRGLVSTVKCFQWCLPKTEVLNVSSSLAVVHEDNSIAHYQFSFDAAGNASKPNSSRLSFPALEDALKDREIDVDENAHIQFLQCKVFEAWILVDFIIVAKVDFSKEDEPKVTHAFDLGHKEFNSPLVSVAGDFLVLLPQGTQFYFYHYPNGKRIAKFDARPYFRDQDALSITTFSISPDLMTLCILTEHNFMLCVSFNGSFSEQQRIRAYTDRRYGRTQSVGFGSNFPKTGSSEVWRQQLTSMTSASKQKTQGVFLSDQNRKSCRTKLSALHMKDTLKFSPSRSTISSSKYSEESCFAQRRKDDFFIANLKDTLGAYCVKHICSGNSFVSFFTADSVEGIDVLLVYEYATDKIRTYRCRSSDSRLIWSNDCHLHLVLESSKLIGISLSAKQEEIINKMMIHDTASLADQLCCLNTWDRCAIPVHTLEVGLKHRQLDTVAFFLKNRESAFCGNSSSMDPSPQYPWTELDILQLDSSIALLTSSIQENINDHTSKQFAEQLLHITLGHLHKVLQSVTGLLPKGYSIGKLSDHDHDEQYEAITSLIAKISQSILCLRKFLKHPYQDSNKFVAVDETDSAPEGQRSEKVLMWQTSSPQVIIEDALLTGCVPIAQSFLRKHHGPDVASREYFTAVGLDSVTRLLKQENLSKACKILANLGFVVNDKLKDVCLHTSDKDLRLYLVNVLNSQSMWTGDESQMVDYLNMIEPLYLSEESQHQLSPLEDPLGLEDTLEKTAGYEKFLAEIEAAGNEPLPILLAWTKEWDKETVDRILLDRTLPYGDTEKCYDVPKETVWKYLVDHNRMNELTTWVKAAFPLKDEETCQARWPYCLPVSMEMVDRLEECSTFVRENILDELARRGVFCTEELQEFNKMLHRLIRIQSVLELDHPLKLRHCNFTIKDFHQNMIDYLIENELMPVLYLYLDFYGINRLEVEHFLSSNPSTLRIPWVQMLLRFRDLASDCTDSTRMIAMSSANASVVCDMYTPEITVQGMVESGLVIPALATMFYLPLDFRQILSGTVKNETLGIISAEDLKAACAAFPKLQTALFPPELSCGMTEQDITVYNLLQGNAPFDPTHLYGWREANLSPHEAVTLPNFSNEEMQARYSHHEVLQPSYYLTHGRPSFAFTTFLSSLLGNGSKSLSKKRITYASMKAHVLALKNFNKPVISGSCVAYVEMLGRDSTILRVSLCTALTIYSYRIRGMMGKLEQRKAMEKRIEQETVNLVISALKNRKKCAPVVLEELEKATQYLIERENLKLSSFEASLRWQPVQLFSRLNKLPYSTVYLQNCAKADNWLHFMTFAQLHQYPSDQLLDVLHLFPSSQLREHLQYVISSVNTTSRASPPPAYDPRKSSFIQSQSQLISKVLGVSKGKDKEPISEEDTSSTDTSIQQEQGDTPKPLPHINKEAVPDNLFGVLFMCQNTPFPWLSLLKHSVALENPILAILAACYKDCSLLDCLSTWLVCSSDEEVYTRFTSSEKSSWSLSDLEEVMFALLQKKHLTCLSKGFSIFQKNSSLVPLLTFCQFVCRRDWLSAKKCLLGFKECLLSGGDLLHSASPSPTSFGSPEWELQMSRQILLDFLKNTASTTDVAWILRNLHETGVTLSIKIDKPDLHQLYNLYVIANDCNTRLQFDKLSEPAMFNEECEAFIAELIQREKYDDARRFAKAAGQDTVTITMKQVEENLRRVQGFSLWQSEEGRVQFWDECSQIFSNNRVPPDIAAQFFQNQSPNMLSHGENDRLLQLAYDWLNKEDESPEQTLDEVQMAIWRNKIQMEMDKQGDRSPDCLFYDHVLQTHQFLHAKPEIAAKLDLLIYGKMPRESIGSTVSLTPEEVRALDSLLGKMLGQGKISEACRLAAEFCHYSQDLAVILTCIRLAQGVVTPQNMDEGMKKLANKGIAAQFGRKRSISYTGIPRNPSGLTLSSSFGSSADADLSSGPSISESIAMETISTMEKLLDHCNHGNQSCARVITAFKIGQALKRSYEDVINEKEYTLLETILSCDHGNKFYLARDYIVTNRLSDEEIAGFLCEIITHSLSVITKKDPEVTKTTSPSELIFNPLEDASVFTSFIKLCSDPSVLGNRLLEAATSMANTSITGTQVQGALAMEVELLIRSHECHTIACNMEGIASVLRTARQLTSNLAQAEEFTLMIRLLTGIGRFNEMTYIFDLLKQYHQFELLFRKGMEKENKLKLAVLDYLKRFHPTDSDTYTMVSLHFTMYREIAQMLEENAIKQLQLLKHKPLDTSSETQAKLKDIQQYFCDAAESYIKEECLRHAQHCIRQARLVALQIHLLNSGTMILNLDNDGLTKFITNHGKFYEAFILAEAYSRKSDWATALCQQVAIAGDFTYLQDFQSYMQLTPSLIGEVAEKFKRETNKPSQANANMKKLLNQCRDVQLRYKLATSLGFTDVVMDLHKGEGGAYLRDTVSA